MKPDPSAVPALPELIEGLPRKFESEEAAKGEWQRLGRALGFEASSTPTALEKFHSDFDSVRKALQSGGPDPEEAARAAYIEAEGWPLLKPLRNWSTVRQPPMVLWRVENDERRPDAVLSEGEVAILSSPGGVGKSTLVLQWALAAVRASEEEGVFGEACGLRVRPGPVVLVSYEDSPGRIALRAKVMGSIRDGLHVWDDPDPLLIADSMGQGRVIPFPGWSVLWRAIARIKPSLIVIDPISAALAGVNSNDILPVRQFMVQLAKQAAAVNTGVLLVAHDTKQSRNQARVGDDPGAGAIAGSAAWFDAARGVLYMSKNADDKSEGRTLTCLKANYGRSGWSIQLVERVEGNRFLGFRQFCEQASKEPKERNYGV